MDCCLQERKDKGIEDHLMTRHGNSIVYSMKDKTLIGVASLQERIHIKIAEMDKLTYLQAPT